MPASRFHVVAGVLGALAAATGSVHLVGWLAGWEVLRAPPPGLIPMAPNTALAFLALGSAEAVLALWPESRRGRAAALTASLAVGALALATLAVRLTADPTALDRLLVTTSARLGTVPLGAMSPVTALGFLVACAGVLIARRADDTRRASVGGACGLAVMTIGGTVAFGYLLGSPLLYGTGTIPMALTTALAFTALGVARILAGGPASWPLRPLLGEAPSARMLRTFLPLTVAVVIVLEVLEARVFVGSGANRALIATWLLVATIALLTTLVGRVSGRLGRTLEEAFVARKAADARAETLAHQNQLLLAHAAEGILGLDAEGRISFANPAAARLLEWQPEDLVGRPFHATLQHTRSDGTPLPSSQSSVLAALRAGTTSPPMRESLCTRPGANLPVEARLAPLADGGGVLTFSDLRERLALEQQFLQAQKMEAIGRIAGGVAHDFNNVLTALRANAELALASLPPEHPVRVELDEMQMSITRATELTRRLLDFSRQPAAGAEGADAAAVLRSLEPMLQRVLPRTVRLAISVPPEPLLVRVGTGSLEQGLLNLVVNARDAMPRGGDLSVSAHAAVDPQLGACAVIRVRDTGTGMDAATRERIFEPFFTTKPEGVGTGLGLSMVYGIVQRAGGRIDLETAPAAGTTFTLLLPLERRAPAEATILLVEDEAPVRSTTTRILEMAGYRVLAAGDGAEAIKTAGAYPHPIHLVITDTFLPGMPFSTVVDQIRTARPQARLIRMSGYPAEMRQELGLVNDDTPFLPKPFSPDDLLSLVRRTLGRRSDPERGAAPETPAGGQPR